MGILEMIEEWRKGCSCASKESPEYCPECTKGLIDAIEKEIIWIKAKNNPNWLISKLPTIPKEREEEMLQFMNKLINQ